MPTTVEYPHEEVHIERDHSEAARLTGLVRRYGHVLDASAMLHVLLKAGVHELLHGHASARAGARQKVPDE